MRNWSKRLLAGLAKRAGTPENADAWAVAEEIRKWELEGLADEWDDFPTNVRAAACDTTNYALDSYIGTFDDPSASLGKVLNALEVLQKMLKNSAERAEAEMPND